VEKNKTIKIRNPTPAKHTAVTTRQKTTNNHKGATTIVSIAKNGIMENYYKQVKFKSTPIKTIPDISRV
jgi:hypothetical protein